MSERLYRLLLVVGTGLLGGACTTATEPTTLQLIAGAGPPNFTATVTQNTHAQFNAPSGYFVEQYEVWVAIPPSAEANAGVVYAAATPVYLKQSGQITRDTALDIRVGDQLQVWHNSFRAMGSSQAPPGDTAYEGTMALIVR